MKLITYGFLSLGLFLIWACAGGQGGFVEGQRLYELHCANCHMSDGTGLGGLIPPLAKADFLEIGGLQAACWIRNGLAGRIQVNGEIYENEMPANIKLSDTEITNILNYIHNAWGNQRGFISLKEVQGVLEACKGD